MKLYYLKQYRIGKLFFVIILLFSALTLKAQDQYSNGFNTGYRKGCCYGKGAGCISPIPPIPPLPAIDDNLDSYQDGYNKGFSMGLEEQKQEKSIQGQGYQTTTPQSIDFIYKIDASSILKIAAAQKQIKGMALENYTNKEYSTCIYLCSRLLPSDPYDGELYLLMGMSYYAQKNYERALYNLKKGRQYDPTAIDFDKIISQVQEDYNKTKN